ncbi:MAG: YMGG-like glycine zipper-containing protein [Sphingobacteriaceae bacterium]
MKNIITFFLALASIITACGSNANSNKEALANAKKYKDSVRLDSFKRADAVNKEVARREAKVDSLKSAAAAKTAVNNNHSNDNSGAQSVTTPAETKKKGWSEAAKGTAIGAGAGAVTGILIDKKNGRGAIIGGVVGAGTGYAIGRAKDRKSGRVKPKKQPAQ